MNINDARLLSAESLELLRRQAMMLIFPRRNGAHPSGVPRHAAKDSYRTHRTAPLLQSLLRAEELRTLSQPASLKELLGSLLRRVVLASCLVCVFMNGSAGSDNLPSLVSHHGFGREALAYLPADRPFGVIREERRITLIDRTNGRPLRHVDLPEKVGAVVVSRDGTLLLVKGGNSLWRLSTRDGSVAPIGKKPGEMTEDITEGAGGWFVQEGWGVRGTKASRLCQLIGASVAKGTDIHCQPDFVMPESGLETLGVVPDLDRTRVLAAMVGISNRTVFLYLMQLPTNGSAASVIGRVALAALPLGPVDLVLSENGERLHLLVRTGSASSSGEWLQSWELGPSAAQLRASREMPSRTSMLGPAGGSGRLALLRSGWLSREPIMSLEVDAATLEDVADRRETPIPNSNGAAVVRGTNSTGEWVMVQRSGVATLMRTNGDALAQPWLPGGRAQRWDIVSFHNAGIDLAREKEQPLSISVDPSMETIRRGGVPGSESVHVIHPRWIAAARFSPEDDQCCLVIVDRESEKVRYELKVPGVTTLSPRLTSSSFKVAFSANGEFLAARHLRSVNGDFMDLEWFWLRIADGRAIRQSERRRTETSNQILVTDDGRIIDVADRKSFVLVPDSDASRLEPRAIDVESKRAQLMGNRLLHNRDWKLVSTPLSDLQAHAVEVSELRNRLREWSLSPDGAQIAYADKDGSLRVRPTALVGQTALQPMPEQFECLLPSGRYRVIENVGDRPSALVERGGGSPESRLTLPAGNHRASSLRYHCDPRHGTGFLLSWKNGQLDVWRHDAQLLGGFTHIGRARGLGSCRVEDTANQGQQVFLACLKDSEYRNYPAEFTAPRRYHAFPAAPRETAGLDRLKTADLIFMADDLTTAARVRPALRDDLMPTVEWFDPKQPPVDTTDQRAISEAFSLFTRPGVVASPSRGIVAVASAHLSRIDFWHRGKQEPVVAHWTGPGDHSAREGLYAGRLTVDERHYVACVDGQVVAFDTLTGTVTHGLDLIDKRSNCFVQAGMTVDDVAVIHKGLLKRLDLRPVHGSAIETVLAGPGSHPREIGFLQDGRILASTHDDGLIRFWDVREGRLLVSLFAYATGWAAFAPDGRFDVSDFDVTLPFSWVLPDRPFSALPIEAFMRDRYEPGLLAGALSPEGLRPAPPLHSVDRNLPAARVLTVEPRGSEPALVDVKVKVSYPNSSHSDDAGHGIAEVQLFRDGRMVAVQRLSPPVKSAELTFASVRLPVLPVDGSVQFAVLAFNTDRVKGEAVLYEHSLKASGQVDTRRRSRRAFIIAIGIDTHADSRWNLSYAARDAALFAEQLPKYLAAPQFDELISKTIDAVGPYDPANHGRIKERIREALRDLATGPRAATPDDAVFIAFSGHGVRTNEAGLMLVMPDAPGTSNSPSEQIFRRRSISIDELADWLREIDAGGFTLILDACHTGAMVDAAFLPAPLGERGFGQLAFDKGMRLLAASQADGLAVESLQLKHGLLTYALIFEGLLQRKAQWQQVDGRSSVSVADWLRFGLRRVPKMERGKSAPPQPRADEKSRGLTGPSRAASTASRRSNLQYPVLFDFDREARRRRNDTRLVEPSP